MTEELIQYEVKDRVAYLTINRPERRNSFSENTRRKLIDSWMDFKNDDEIDVAILRKRHRKEWILGVKGSV